MAPSSSYSSSLRVLDLRTLDKKSLDEIPYDTFGAGDDEIERQEPREAAAPDWPSLVPWNQNLESLAEILSNCVDFMTRKSLSYSPLLDEFLSSVLMVHRELLADDGNPISSPASFPNGVTLHYGTKPGHFETSKIHFPTSEGVSEVSEVSERANE